MKRIVPLDTYEEMTEFPYSVPEFRYGCDSKSRELLDSLLYTIEDPDTPDGMMYVMDIDGMKEWFDETFDEEDRSMYECDTVYDYIPCEIGRYVIPLKGWWKE